MNSTFKYTLSIDDRLTTVSYRLHSQQEDQLFITYNINSFSIKDFINSNSIDVSYRKDFSLLPMAVRYADKNANFYIIERPPFQIDLDFSASYSHALKKYPAHLKGKKIWVPWTVTVLSYPSSYSHTASVNMHIFFNTGPIQSLDDKVVPCLFPNTNTGHVCMGDNNQHYYNEIPDVKEVYNHFFNHYFAGWNADLRPHFPNINYFKDKLVELSKQKNGFKDMATFFDHWSNNKKYLTRLLYLWSNLTLEEINGYLDYCKTPSKDVKRSSLRSYIAYEYVNPMSNFQTDDVLMLPYKYQKDFDSRLYSKLSNDQLINTTYTAKVSNFPVLNVRNYSVDLYSQLLHSVVSNPYIVSEAYKMFKDRILENDISSLYMYADFNYEEISQYSSVYLGDLSVNSD